eukprot:442024-Amphidinium_carterae.1
MAFVHVSYPFRLEPRMAMNRAAFGRLRHVCSTFTLYKKVLAHFLDTTDDAPRVDLSMAN